MDLLLDVFSAVLLAIGTFCVFVGGVGVMRMPDFYTRMHAASVTDTGGAGLIIAGLLLQSGFSLAIVKLLAIFLFLFLTSPTASYALANAALLSGHRPACRNESGVELPDGSSTFDVAKAVKAAKKSTAKPAVKKSAAKKAATKKTATKKPIAKKVAKKAVKKAAKKTVKKSANKTARKATSKRGKKA